MRRFLIRFSDGAIGRRPKLHLEEAFFTIIYGKTLFNTRSRNLADLTGRWFVIGAVVIEMRKQEESSRRSFFGKMKLVRIPPPTDSNSGRHS